MHPRAVRVWLLTPTGPRPALDQAYATGSATVGAAPCPYPGPCPQAGEQRGLVLEAACIRANAIVLIGFYEFPPEFLRNTSTLEDFIPANFRLQSQTVYQMNLHRQAYCYAAPVTGVAPAKRLVISSLAEGIAS